MSTHAKEREDVEGGKEVRKKVVKIEGPEPHFGPPHNSAPFWLSPELDDERLVNLKWNKIEPDIWIVSNPRIWVNKKLFREIIWRQFKCTLVI